MLLSPSSMNILQFTSRAQLLAHSIRFLTGFFWGTTASSGTGTPGRRRAAVLDTVLSCALSPATTNENWMCDGSCPSMQANQPAQGLRLADQPITRRSTQPDTSLAGADKSRLTCPLLHISSNAGKVCQFQIQERAGEIFLL